MTKNLDAVLRDRHAVSQIRRLPLIGIDSAGLGGTRRRPAAEAAASPAAPQRPAESNVVTLRPAAPLAGGVPVSPAGAPSTVAVANLDAGHRFAATKVTDRLGWVPGQALYATTRPGRVVIRAGVASEPTHGSVTFDSKRQLRLGTAAVAALGLGAGGQVLAIATAADELVLAGAAAVAELVTGVVVATDDAPEPAAEATGPRRNSRVAKRWQPPAVAIAPTG